MATTSTLLTLSFVVEEDTDMAIRAGSPLGMEEAIRAAVLVAVAVRLNDAGRADVKVEWSSLTALPLDEAAGYGRCEVCNHWTYDAELADGVRRGGVSLGAVVNGRLRCDECLPTDHPLHF